VLSEAERPPILDVADDVGRRAEVYADDVIVSLSSPALYPAVGAADF